MHRNPSMSTLSNNDLYTLDSEEIAFAKSKNSLKNKLVFAICLKFFQIKGTYPTVTDSLLSWKLVSRPKGIAP